MIDISNRSLDACIAYLKYDSIWSLQVIDSSNIAVSTESGLYLFYNQANDLTNGKFEKKLIC